MMEVTAYHVDDSESPPVVVPVKAEAWRADLMRRAMAYEDLAAELHRKASTEPRR